MRMGGAKKFSFSRVVLFVLVLVALVVGSYLVTRFLTSSEEKVPVTRSGCATDSDCQHGTMCAAGGCIILLSSENRRIWREDIAAQRDAGAPWEPAPAFGKKILEAVNCPLRKGDFRKTDYKHVVPVARVNLYEVEAEGLFIHKMITAKGDMWLESLRLSFPGWAKLQKDKICGSESLDSYFTGGGKDGKPGGSDVHVSFKQAIPVGGEATVLVKAGVKLPPRDGEGFRTMTMELEGLAEKEESGSTVLAIPLGGSLVSIEGPPPAKQRLLTGNVAYYWDHEKEPGEVTVRFKVPDFSTGVLDLGEVNP